MFARDMLYSIYINESCVPHYLVMDYVFDYAYRKLPNIKEMIDNHTEYNTKRNELHFLLNKPYKEDTYQQLIKMTGFSNYHISHFGKKWIIRLLSTEN